MRNDLGRICQPGSVQVSNPYTVERYRTLHQMTSTVTGRLRPKTTYAEIFRSLFPCGSITGAPKIRTMQIIRDLERGPRGVYTGAIGFIAPGGRATFNVAIRTLVVQSGMARMGVGGGIVADSDARDEYRECLLKASFLTREPRAFELFETILWDRDYQLLDYHLDRLESSADYFGFPIARDALRQRLLHLSAGFESGIPQRIRLSLTATGESILQSAEFVAEPKRGSVRLATERTASDDVFRRHKTSNRELYDRLHAQAVADGFDDVLFLNQRDEVTEGAITNLFVEKDGEWLTPPVECGVLPGVLRRHLLQTRPNAREMILRIGDIESADALYIGNSLRGLHRVRLHAAGPLTPRSRATPPDSSPRAA
jgi:para-aminobenzoate synthetase/4-amino-4-deoxychorismate lyase